MQMLEKSIQQYYKFFDETIKSSTFIVLIISMIILLIWSIVPNAYAQNYIKGSILESSTAFPHQKNIVVVDGISYEVNFLRIK